ncbi:MAG TPA: hypothetical protein VFT74_22160 [Isosphaeraceae bacterium]|nr:hypothetical protein [Isosphaeraceae bacterium]
MRFDILTIPGASVVLVVLAALVAFLGARKVMASLEQDEVGESEKAPGSRFEIQDEWVEPIEKKVRPPEPVRHHGE